MEMEQPVSRAAVAGGVAASLILSVFVVPGSFLAALYAQDAAHSNPLAVVTSMLGPALVLLVLWLLIRVASRDFARGFLIGASIAALVGGLCNGLIVADLVSQ